MSKTFVWLVDHSNRRAGMQEENDDSVALEWARAGLVRILDEPGQETKVLDKPPKDKAMRSKDARRR